MAATHERLVENQRVFRSANERLQELVQRVPGDDGQLVPFLCECADDACLGRIDVTLTDYEEAHSEPGDYFILHGHLRTRGEEILAEADGYDVVRKHTA